MTFYPISRNQSIAPTLIVCSVVVAVIQSFIGPSSNWGVIWSNLGASAMIAACLWDINSRYHLIGSHGNYAFMMGMVLLPAATNLPLLYLPEQLSPALDGGPQRLLPAWMLLVGMASLVVILFLAFSIWQQRTAPMAYLLVGCVIGGLSFVHAHYLYWVFLIPGILYHTRSFSLRNLWSAVTGVVLGLWVVYFLAFWANGDVADGLLKGLFTELFHFQNLEITHYSLWPLIYMVGFSIPALFITLTGFLPGAGESIRTRDSLSLSGTFSIFFLIMSLFDGAMLPFYVSLMSITLTLQLSIRQGMSQTVAGEWWNLLYMIFLLVLGAAPMFVGAFHVVAGWLGF